MRPDRRTWASLLLLACAAFAYNTSESFPVGLLPQMSEDLGVRESTVGSLLTLYAIVVAVTVLPLVVATSGVARRRLVLLTLGVLVASNVALSFAPSFEWVLVARLTSATTHGIFWSVVAPTAAMLVPRGREGFATSVAFAGSSLAMVAGTPLTTALGNALGWRASVMALAIAAAIALIGLAVVMPPLTVDRKTSSGTSTWPAVFSLTVRNRLLLRLCALTIALVVAYFSLYTYIALYLGRFAGVQGDTLALVLLLFGIAGLIGVWAVGKTSDRYPDKAAILCMSALATAFTAVAAFASWAPAGVIFAVILLGAAFAATPVFLQATVLRVAPKTSDVASSLYVIAFQIGIAGGSLAGGLAVDQGQLQMVPWAAAAVVVIAMLTLRVSVPAHTLGRANRSA